MTSFLLKTPIFCKILNFDEANMIIMPGYCVAGTYGHKILNGQKRLEFEKGVVTEVKCENCGDNERSPGHTS